MTPVLLDLGATESLVGHVADLLSSPVVPVETHRFPNGETLVRLDGDVRGVDALIFCSLDHPNEKILPLLFAADAARAQGARRVGLVAPYLAYMRQDRAFHDGEAVTSRSFARVISGAFDWLLTIDAHLHRYESLGEIYSIPATTVSASRAIANWIGSNVERPIMLGPDAESEQWVAQVAALLSAPHAVFAKTRLGDYEVQIDGSRIGKLDGTPVILDDLISSGRTMAEAVALVNRKSLQPPVCIAVHGLFAGDAYEVLKEAGPARICTTDTIAHETNDISISAELAAAIGDWARA